MEAEEIAANVDELELRLERLRVLYDQYFMGIEKIPPAVQQKDVDRRVWLLRREKIRNTGIRFRFQTICQRYNTFQSFWARICREIENGTYKRHVQKAQAKFAEAAKAKKAEEAAYDLDVDLDVDLEAELEDVLAAPPARFEDEPLDPPFGAMPAKAPSRETQAPAPQRTSSPGAPPKKPEPPPRNTQAPPLPAARATVAPTPASSGTTPAAPPRNTQVPAPRNTQAPAPRDLQSVPRILARKVEGDADLDAMLDDALGAPPPKPEPSKPEPPKPAAAPLRPTAAQPAARATVQPTARPATQPATPGATRPAAPAPKPAAAASTKADDPYRGVYERYVEARRKNGESTANVTYESLAKNLRDTTEKLKGKTGGKAVDFDVVVKDGKTILKPVVR